MPALPVKSHLKENSDLPPRLFPAKPIYEHNNHNLKRLPQAQC